VTLAIRARGCYSPVNQAARRSAVILLIVAMAVGIAIALGGTVVLTNVLSSQANGAPTPASSSLYNYGTR
jgi:hypothetical protein